MSGRRSCWSKQVMRACHIHSKWQRRRSIKCAHTGSNRHHQWLDSYLRHRQKRGSSGLHAVEVVLSDYIQSRISLSISRTTFRPWASSRACNDTVSLPWWSHGQQLLFCEKNAAYTETGHRLHHFEFFSLDVRRDFSQHFDGQEVGFQPVAMDNGREFGAARIGFTCYFGFTTCV